MNTEKAMADMTKKGILDFTMLDGKKVYYLTKETRSWLRKYLENNITKQRKQVKKLLQDFQIPRTVLTIKSAHFTLAFNILIKERYHKHRPFYAALLATVYKHEKRMPYLKNEGPQLGIGIAWLPGEIIDPTTKPYFY